MITLDGVRIVVGPSQVMVSFALLISRKKVQKVKMTIMVTLEILVILESLETLLQLTQLAVKIVLQEIQQGQTRGLS